VTLSAFSTLPKKPQPRLHGSYDMSKREMHSALIGLILLIIIMFFAAWIEPCDGHSCDNVPRETIYGVR